MRNLKIKICYVVNVDIMVKFILFDILKFLKNQGYDIYIVCSSGKWMENIESIGIKVKPVKFKRKISPISDLITLFRLILYFRREKFDIVHTHSPKPGLLGQLGAKMAGVPLIINTNHGFYFQENDSWAKRKFFILIEKISARCSDLIFSVNREDIETAIRERICRPDLIKYLGNGINTKRFDPSRFPKEFIEKKKKDLNIKPGFKVVGIVGRLVKEKGYIDLFTAFKRVLKEFPQTLLLIIGPEEYEKVDAINTDVVENYGIEKNVKFLGERTDVDELYPLMDIFVLPSHREGLGIVMLEASAMKRSIIASDIRGCREAIEDNKTGILVPVKNPEKLEEMGRKGREKVLREFDERQIFSRIKIEYQRLISRLYINTLANQGSRRRRGSY